jgi:NADPH-dependent 2,4-dienoyl-CoA reductase/sulfur reductase-like enzyme
MNQPVVVVGNGVAGHACATRLADLGIPVTMVGPGIPHDRPPLSKRSLSSGRIPLLKDADKLAEKGVRHVDGLVTSVDLATRTLQVQPSDGGEPLTLAAPRLVWATGLRYPKPPVPGLDEHGHENATAVGMLALHEQIREPGKRVVVIGAGLIGTESAATLGQNHSVRLADMVDRPLARFLPPVTTAALAMLDTLGVPFLGECRIDGVEELADGTKVVRTSTHGDLECDVVVSAAGFRTSLLDGLAEDPRALAMPCDETLRVEGHDGFWAAGDCLTFPHPRWGRIGIPHWDHAHWSGKHVADVIAGADAPYLRDPYFFSDIASLRIQQVGYAPAAVEWADEDGLQVGRDADGRPACVLFMNAPARLREARELIADPS